MKRSLFAVLGMLVLAVLVAAPIAASENAEATEPAATAAPASAGVAQEQEQVVCFAPEPSQTLGRPAPLAEAEETAACYCEAQATCWNGTTKFCSDSTSPCQCEAVDANCSAGQRGYVKCNGVQQNCPTCPPCHNHCEPCSSYGQTDGCGCTCKQNVYCCGSSGCGVRIGAWICLVD